MRVSWGSRGLAFRVRRASSDFGLRAAIRVEDFEGLGLKVFQIELTSYGCLI